MEQSAVWMEDRTWDDVNDYLAYLYNFFGGKKGNMEYPNNSKKFPLDENNGQFKYGAAVWAMFLAQRYGDDQIRINWETLRDASYPYIGAFDEALKKGTSDADGLSDALADFAVWNYFIHDRANTTNFYRDGELYGRNFGSDLFWNFSPASDSLDINNLTSRYIELLFVGDWAKNDFLSVKVTSLNGGSFRSSVLFYNDLYDYDIIPISRKGDKIQLSQKWNKAILITTCTNTNSQTYSFRFETEMEPSVGVDVSPYYSFALHESFPNPFNPTTTIEFELPETGMAEITIYNIAGQKVRVLLNSYKSAGLHHVARDDRGNDVSAGVYISRLIVGDVTAMGKMVLVR